MALTEDDDDAASILTFHTANALPAPPPKTHPHHRLQHTDTIPTLTAPYQITRSRLRPRLHIPIPKVLDPEEQLRDEAKKQERERNKDDLRWLKSLPYDSMRGVFPPTLTKNKSSRWNKAEARACSAVTQSEISSLLKSAFFWASLTMFMAGLASASAAIGVISTGTTDSKPIPKGIVFWLVVSLVVLLFGLGLTVLITMRTGKVGEGFLRKVGFGEVQNPGQGDVEKGQSRAGGGLIYLGVGNRDCSTLGGGASVRSLPRSASKSGDRGVQGDVNESDFGAQRLRPTALRRDGAVSRMGFRGDGQFEDVELESLGGDGRKFGVV
jgi:hypothetical protein